MLKGTSLAKFKLKAARKMLLKSSLGVNFINILLTNFLDESALRSFSLLAIWLCNFWHKNIGAKGLHKMLIKLTPGWELLFIR